MNSSKYACLAVLLLALSGTAFASGGTRSLQARAGASSVAISSSVSETTVKNVLADAFAQAKADTDGGQVFSIARAAAQEIGEAFAQAYASVSGSVFATEGGFASTSARADASATAEIFGKAIASAVGEATGPAGSSLSAANAQEQTAAIANAVAEVNIELSTDGGFAEATSTAVATAVAKVTATAIGEALAFSVEEQSATQVQTEATVDVQKEEDASVTTTVETGGNSQAIADGSAEAIAKEYTVCQIPRMCCSDIRVSPDGKNCIQDGNGGWRYYRSDYGNIEVWTSYANDSDVCKCP